MNRVNLITLGVKDLPLSYRFYKEGLGFQTTVSEVNPSIVFFNNAGTKLALYPLASLSKDISGNENLSKQGFSGVTFAYNAKSAEEVDVIMENAQKAGGTIVKPAQKVFWGGYSGYFADPDGYYWEVAYSKDWRFDQHDMLIIE